MLFAWETGARKALEGMAQLVPRRAEERTRAKEWGVRGGADSPGLSAVRHASTARKQSLCAVTGCGSSSPDTPGPQVPRGTGAVTNNRSGRFRSNVGSKVAFRLLADSELADDIAVAVGIVGLQVVQQTAALADQLQETTA